MSFGKIIPTEQMPKSSGITSKQTMDNYLRSHGFTSSDQYNNYMSALLYAAEDVVNKFVSNPVLKLILNSQASGVESIESFSKAHKKSSEVFDNDFSLNNELLIIEKDHFNVVKAAYHATYLKPHHPVSFSDPFNTDPTKIKYSLFTNAFQNFENSLSQGQRRIYNSIVKPIANMFIKDTADSINRYIELFRIDFADELSRELEPHEMKELIDDLVEGILEEASDSIDELNTFLKDGLILTKLETREPQYNYIDYPHDINPIYKVNEEMIPSSPSETRLALEDTFRVIPRTEFNEYLLGALAQNSSQEKYLNKSIEELKEMNISYVDLAYSESNTLVTFSSLLEIFNEANVKEMQRQEITDAYEWEFLKIQQFKKADINEEYEKLLEDVMSDPLMSSVKERKLKELDLEIRSQNLPELMDKQVEFIRDMGIQGLIMSGQLDDANKMIELYEKMPNTMVEGINNATKT